MIKKMIWRKIIDFEKLQEGGVDIEEILKCL